VQEPVTADLKKPVSYPREKKETADEGEKETVMWFFSREADKEGHQGYPSQPPQISSRKT